AVVGIYGVLKAGATYVPFDEQSPLERLAYIARNAEIRLLVTSNARSAHWAGLTEAGAPLETLYVADAEGAPEGPAGVRVVPGRAHQRLVLRAFDPDDASAARLARAEPARAAAHSAVCRRGLPREAPAHGHGGASGRSLLQPLRADRDERLHLVRGSETGSR